MNQVLEEILATLKKNKIEYQLFEHEPVFTSSQAAKVRNLPLSLGVKSLIFMADGKPVMIVVPGDRKVAVHPFAKKFGIKDLRMATPEEVENTVGVKIGAVHPLGNLAGIKVYADQNLGKEGKIAFNPGVHDKTLIMSFKDYLKLTDPIIGSFAKI